MKRMSCLLALVLSPAAANGALYKCVADDGHVTYRDTPCVTTVPPLALDAPPPASAPAGLRPGEREMLERAYRRDEREAVQHAQASRNAAAELRLGKLRKRKDEIARELGGSIGGKAQRSALADERRSIEREMATLRPRR
jgi:hypothetical protein